MKPFAHPVRHGKMSCSDCHSTHGFAGDGMMTRQTVNDTCYECHAEMRGPFLWEHAPVPEDCGNCHDPHGSNYAGMLSMRPPTLCQGCHSQQGCVSHCPKTLNPTRSIAGLKKAAALAALRGEL